MQFNFKNTFLRHEAASDSPQGYLEVERSALWETVHFYENHRPASVIPYKQNLELLLGFQSETILVASNKRIHNIVSQVNYAHGTSIVREKVLTEV